MEAALNFAHEKHGKKVSFVRGLDMHALTIMSLKCIIASSPQGGHGDGYPNYATHGDLMCRMQAILCSWLLHKTDIIQLRDEVCCAAGMTQGVQHLRFIRLVLCCGHIDC